MRIERMVRKTAMKGRLHEVADQHIVEDLVFYRGH